MSLNYTSIGDIGLTRDDPAFWSQPTPIDCPTVRVIGLFLCVAALAGIVLNGSLIIS
ncbi:unnamed protein product, partial [Adineta steineri]